MIIHYPLPRLFSRPLSVRSVHPSPVASGTQTVGSGRHLFFFFLNCCNWNSYPRITEPPLWPFQMETVFSFSVYYFCLLLVIGPHLSHSLCSLKMSDFLGEKPTSTLLWLLGQNFSEELAVEFLIHFSLTFSSRFCLHHSSDLFEDLYVRFREHLVILPFIDISARFHMANYSLLENFSSVSFPSP